MISTKSSRSIIVSRKNEHVSHVQETKVTQRNTEIEYLYIDGSKPFDYPRTGNFFALRE